MAAFSLQSFTARANCYSYRDALRKLGSFVMPRPARRAKKPSLESMDQEASKSPNRPTATKTKPKAKTQPKPKSKPKQQPKRKPQPESVAIENESMADRYYAIAESMNTRGAMELAVPFYRQAVALLLCERDNLRQQLPEGQSEPANKALPIDELHGLLEAAQALQGQQEDTLKTSPEETFANNNEDISQQIEAAEAIEVSKPSLDSRINELAEELTPSSAQQVLVGLLELEKEVNSLPASGLSLRGKALMLQGEQAAALASFESAMALSPNQPELRINTGAARLANSDSNGALSLLREVHREGLEQLDKPIQNALLRNLSTAENQAGNIAEALRLRSQWLQLNPVAVPIQKWLGWALSGIQQPFGDPIRLEAISMLKELHKLAPDERSVLEPLAMALEEEGEYRAASLFYRKLLRPINTTASQE